MADIWSSIHGSVIEATDNLKIWKYLVLLELLRRGRCKSHRGIQRNEYSVRVLHPELVKDVRQVPFLREVDCALLSVLCNPYTEMLRRLFMPLDIV